MFTVPYIGPLVLATCSLKLHFHLWVHEKSEKAKNCPVHSNEHYSILIIVFFRKTYCFLSQAKYVCLKMWQQIFYNKMAWRILFFHDKTSEIAHSKTSECYLQAWAWARRAGSARRASGLAADGGGEPRAPRRGSSPASNLCKLGTIQQPI